LILPRHVRNPLLAMFRESPKLPSTHQLPMQILVIEDEKRVADLIKRGLEDQDYTVELSLDGTTGKALALQRDYDIIIMDVVLPGINGIDLCKEVRLVKPDIPIIMLTALGTTDDKVEGLDAWMPAPSSLRAAEKRSTSPPKNSGCCSI
jgi:CheY-like chemotaxis protein